MLDWEVFDRYRVTEEKPSQSNRIRYLVCDRPLPKYPKTAVVKIVPKTEENLRECRMHLTLSRLTPLVVQCYCIREDHQTEYRLYLEYCELGSLSDIYDQRRGELWSAVELATMWRAMLRAIAVLHEANYVHRDIKPGNFFVTVAGEVKLGDFGDTKQTLAQDLALLTSGIHGTIAYFSPLQRQDYGRALMGQPRIQPNADCFASDLFALGTTFLTMVEVAVNLGRLSGSSPESEVVAVVARANYPPAFSSLVNSMRASDVKPSVSRVLQSVSDWFCRVCDCYVPLCTFKLCIDTVCEGCLGTYLQTAAQISSGLENNLFCPFCGSQIDLNRYLSTATPMDKSKFVTVLREKVRFLCVNQPCKRKFAPFIDKNHSLQSFFRSCECGFQGCSWCQCEKRCSCSIKLP